MNSSKPIYIFITFLFYTSQCFSDVQPNRNLYNDGVKYWFGNGVGVDKKKACDLFYQSAVNGYVLAQYNYANCLRKGEGRLKDVEASIKWYKKAADKGDSSAMSALAGVYIFEYKKEKKAKKIYSLLTQAIQSKNEYAEFLMGYIYHKGIYVEKNENRSLSSYVEAANKGHALSQAALSEIYKCGLNGQKINYEKHKYWKSVFDLNVKIKKINLAYDEVIDYLKDKGFIEMSFN